MFLFYVLVFYWFLFVKFIEIYVEVEKGKGLWFEDLLVL